MRIFCLLILTVFLTNIGLGQDSSIAHPFAVFVIPLRPNTVFLDKAGKAILDSASKFANENRDTYVQVESFSYASERDYQLSWDKAFSAVKYLRTRQIDSTRISFMYGLEGDRQAVRVSFWKTNENLWDIPLPPAPIPCYSYHKLTPKRCKEAH
jgi:hypothetical protein